MLEASDLLLVVLLKLSIALLEASDILLKLSDLLLVDLL